MGRVLEALRQLECKQGSPSSAGSAPTQPAGILRQEAISDDHLAPPPEYLTDGLALRQGAEIPVLVSGSAATAGLPSSADTWLGATAGLSSIAAGITAGQASSATPALSPEPSLPVASDNAPPRGAYDELAETILAQIVPGRPAALWFTSAEEGIGRTAMVASLAAALARRESQGVLAVDADFRRPAEKTVPFFRLGSHFGAAPDPGLAGVLCGCATWEEAIAATEIPSLFVLPAGRSDGLPPADRLAPLLEQWRGRFRLVLFDAPSPIRPEAACLARHFDGVYLALRLGRTRKRALRRALRALESAGGRFLGSILLQPTGTG
jgi:Mrp family chromosome partitioning ATPase